jgi:SAM-dependent methyltransferase
MSLERLMSAPLRVRSKLARLIRTFRAERQPSIATVKHPKKRALLPVPREWEINSWEEKARQNPLYAVMTTTDFVDARPDGFSDEQLRVFFTKGRDIFDVHLKPRLQDDKNAFVVEYGCGMGRILKPLLEAGYECAGIDISPTMLAHCQRLVPAANALYLLDDAGRSALPDGIADFVFSYAVLQHIQGLAAYLKALDELCRLLKPGGTFAVQVNCEDFVGGLDRPDRTENFEDRSVHYRAGETVPYSVHPQSTWSGVYIGEALLRQELAQRGCQIEEIYYHNPAKLRAIWAVGKKDPMF